MVAFSFRRSRALNIKNDLCARIDFFRRNIAAGFDQHFEVFITQTLDQIKSFALRQRLAAAALDQLALEVAHLLHDIVDSKLLTTPEGGFAVAPRATHL